MLMLPGMDIPFNNPEVKPVYAVPFKGKLFTTDNLGNLFLVYHDNSVVKYNKSGVKQAWLNSKILGDLSQLDVSNPFEIYAWYRDQQTLLILDNLLSIRATINLSELRTGEISSVCRSFDNGIWFFDAGNTKLFKSDKSVYEKQVSLPFASWTSARWLPFQMLDNDKNLFVHDSLNGIAVFDVFANYYKTVSITGLKDFQVKKSSIFYFKDQFLQQHDIKWLNTDTLYFDVEAKSIRLDGDLLFNWKRDSIFVYPFGG